MRRLRLFIFLEIGNVRRFDNELDAMCGRTGNGRNDAVLLRLCRYVNYDKDNYDSKLDNERLYATHAAQTAIDKALATCSCRNIGQFFDISSYRFIPC